MFKIDDNPTFKRTVEVMVPADGGHDRHTMDATFQVVPSDEFGKFNLNTGEGSTEMLKRILVKLDDIVGADGKPLPWSDAVRDRLINLPYVRRALVKSYFTAMGAAAEGN